MHFNFYLTLQTALLATTALARPSKTLSRANHGLMKRHFWCNGVDSESICPEGQTMVPIDDYACNAIASAGRMNQISAPVNGEQSTNCPQVPAAPAQQQPAPQVSAAPAQQQPAPQVSAAPAPQQPAPQVSTPPTNQGNLESSPSGGSWQQKASKDTVNPSAGQGSLESTPLHQSEKPANIPTEPTDGQISAPATNSTGGMHVTCTGVSGTTSGSSFMLNCTMAA